MNTPLALLLAICLAYAAWFLLRYGLRACLYMLSARIEALGDAVGLYRLRRAEYTAAALERAGWTEPAKVDEVKEAEVYS